MSEPKLKPCPFCGEPPLVMSSGDGTKRKQYVIKCMEPECYTTVCTATYLTKEEAIIVWNTRLGE